GGRTSAYCSVPRGLADMRGSLLLRAIDCIAQRETATRWHFNQIVREGEHCNLLGDLAQKHSQTVRASVRCISERRDRGAVIEPEMSGAVVTNLLRSLRYSNQRSCT